MQKKPRIALWHRYGPAGHTACGGHCIPEVVRLLSEHCEVHYFGSKDAEPTPQLIANHAVVHTLPWRFDRASHSDKLLKTILWYLATPLMALKCRFLGVKCIFNDETLPLMAPLLRLFYGRTVAISVADFFLTIYAEEKPLLRPLCRLIQSIDFATWRKLPLIFTKVNYTKTYLAKHGINPDKLQTSYNPCDRSVYFPRDKTEARRRLGISSEALVLVHHGILHPNKGNDRIIRALSELRDEFPSLIYLLVGGGPEQAKLEQLIQDLGMQDQVMMTGWLPTEEDVNWALNAADIGLVMRIGQFSDNFHLTDTLSHEMACGLPVLAADLAGIRESTTQAENGALFDADDMSQFKEHLSRLAKDPDLRQRQGKASLTLVEKHLDSTRIAAGIAGSLLPLVLGKVGE